MPGATVTVGAEAGGRVVAVQVVEGDMARRGSVLATLDRAETRAALEEARARPAESEAHLAFLPRDYDRIDSLRRGDHVSAEELDAVTRACAVAQDRSWPPGRRSTGSRRHSPNASCARR